MIVGVAIACSAVFICFLSMIGKKLMGYCKNKVTSEDQT